jgi:hypothetical protein
MGCKRKNDDATAVHTTRPPPPVPRTRAVAMHMMPSRRIGQSTTFLTADPPAPPSGTSLHAADGRDPVEADSDFLDVSSDVGDAVCEEIGNSASGDDKAWTPLQDWATHHRQTYLNELIRHNGRAGLKNCAECEGNGLYKCKDCFGSQLLCRGCFFEWHTRLPLHRTLVRRRTSPTLPFSDVLCSTGQGITSKTLDSNRWASRFFWATAVIPAAFPAISLKISPLSTLAASMC